MSLELSAKNHVRDQYIFFYYLTDGVPPQYKDGSYPGCAISNKCNIKSL